MYWPSQNLHGSGVNNAGANKAEQTNVDDLDGETLEKLIGNGPLDLSGFGDKNQKRDVESPLDLSVKTRKRHADSTEQRDVYALHSSNYPTLKRSCTGIEMDKNIHLATEPRMLNPGYELSYGSRHKKMAYNASRNSEMYPVNVPYNQKSSIKDQGVIKQNENLNIGWSAPHVTQSVEVSRPQDMYPAMHPSTYPYPNANPVRKSSDEQYYAMIQAIQKQNKVAKLEKIEQRRKLVADQSRQNTTYFSPSHTQGNTINKNYQMSTNSNFCVEKPSNVQQRVRTAEIPTSNYSSQSSHLTWAPTFIDHTQRCSPDSTYNPIQNTQRNRIQIHQGANVYGSNGPTSVISHAGNKLYMTQRHPQSNNEQALPKSQEYRKVQHCEQSQLSQYSSDAVPVIPKQDYHQTGRSFPSSAPPKSVRSHHSHFTPMPSPLASPRTTHSSQLSRSIVRGTSGLNHEHVDSYGQAGHSSFNISRRNCEKQPSAGSLTSQNCVQSCNGHEVMISSTSNDPMMTNYIQQQHKKSCHTGAVQNHQERANVHISEKNVRPIETTNKWKMCDMKESMILVEKRKINPEKRNVTCTSTIVQQERKTCTDESSSEERYTSPLSITIPHGAEASRKQSPKPEVKEEKKEIRPKPFSKKHIIMNAVQKDEGLKAIVNSVEKPKTVIHHSHDVKTSNLRSQNSSPVCPESPKMPTLSPQQRLPPPPLVSPLIGEPPKLDIAAGQRHDTCLKTSPQRIYYQGSRPRLLSSLPRKRSSVINDEDDDEDDHDVKKEMVAHESTVFRPFMHYKKIPIANVAPMVHKSVSSENDSTATSSSNQNATKRNTDDDKPLKVEQGCENFKSLSSKMDTPMTIKDAAHVVQDKENPKVCDKVLEKLTHRSDFESYNEKKLIVETSDTTDEKSKPCAELHMETGTEKEEGSLHKTRRQRHPSILQKIASSEGFVTDSRLKKTSNNLLDDPDLLGREGRALRRAIIQFKRMEKKDEQISPRHLKLSKAQTKAGEICRKARRRLRQNRDVQEKQSQYIKRRGEHKKSKYKGFIDFKPEVLVSRTRTQAAGLRGLVKYNRNAAYENELNKHETRKALKHKTRPRQDGGKVPYNTNEHSADENIETDNLDEVLEDKDVSASRDSKASLPSKGTDAQCESSVPPNNVLTHDSETGENLNVAGTDKPENGGIWEIGGTSTSLKQTLRNGKSKGGIMMKLLFRPKEKRRFRRRSSTQRIGKYRRRPRFRGRKNLQGAIKSRAERSRQRKIVASNCAEDDDVFVTDVDQNEENSTVMMTTTDDIYSSDLMSFSNIGATPEIKKLAVYKDTGETLLHRAARLGHLDVIITCLQSGNIDINTKDNAGYTPLHESCVSGHIDIARLLIRHGANVNCASQDGIRPIHDAVENEHIEIVRLLIVYGADPTIATYGGLTPLKIARSDLMHELLNGCIGDINGFPADEEETVWEFDFSYSSSHHLPDTNVFIDVPDDPSDEIQKDYLTESLSPCFPIFTPGKHSSKEKSVSYNLVDDVCEYYKVETTVIQDLMCLSMKEIRKCDLTSDRNNQCAYDRLSAIPGPQCSLLQIQDVNIIHNKLTGGSACKTREKLKMGSSKQKPELNIGIPIHDRRKVHEHQDQDSKRTRRKLVYDEDTDKSVVYHKKRPSAYMFSNPREYEYDSSCDEHSEKTDVDCRDDSDLDGEL